MKTVSVSRQQERNGRASRNRLREMKAAAKRAREASEAVVTELPSPKKTKGKHVCEDLKRE